MCDTHKGLPTKCRISYGTSRTVKLPLTTHLRRRPTSPAGPVETRPRQNPPAGYTAVDPSNVSPHIVHPPSQFPPPPFPRYTAPTHDPNADPMTTLLTGATGFVGSAVARVLAARGHQPALAGPPHQRPAQPRRAGRRDRDRRPDRPRLAGARRRRLPLRRPRRRRLSLLGAGPRRDAARQRRRHRRDDARRPAGRRRAHRALQLGRRARATPPTARPADETTPVDEAGMVGTYKRSKYLAEQAVLDLVRTEGLPAVVVNPAAPVGPRDIKPTPTGKMIVDAANGRMPGLSRYRPEHGPCGRRGRGPRCWPWNAAGSASATSWAARTST